MKQLSLIFPACLVCCLVLAALPAAATVTRYADFPLGEAGSLGSNNRPQDVSGNNRHFTADSGGATAITGTAGVAAPGSTTFLDTSAASDQSWSGGPSLGGVTDNFAIGIYARAASNAAANQGDILCSAGSGDGTFKLSLASGWVASAHNIVYIGTTATFTPNTWAHLALIRSGGQTTFFVNGVAQGASYGPAPTLGAVCLGSFGGISVFDGQMDDARIVTFSAGETPLHILAALQSPAAPLTTPPAVTSEPPDQTVYGGDTVTLVAPAVGAVPMTWRWYAGTTLLTESTTTAALTLTHVTTAQAGNYHAEIANAYGGISSRSVALTVLPALITLAPATTPNAGQQAMIARKYGMFCHFGINTFQDQQWTDGTLSPSTYTPTAVDVEQWVRTAYLSGMTYILIIAKHHDGFCMWPSAQTSYDVASSSNTTDVLQLAAAACAKYGIKLAVYYSLWDRNWSNGAMRNDANSLTAAQGAAYVSYMKSQLTELLTHYGPVCELWLDGSWVGPASIWNLPDVYNHVKQLQPNCQIASNITIVNPPASQSAGDAIKYFPSDFRLNDPDLPKFPDPKTFSYGGDTYYLPFEATITLSSQNFWFYDTRETASKSLLTLENWWNTATAQNNLLVLNAAPNRNGVLLPWDVATLATLASRLGLEPGGAFPINLASAATATASSIYNNDAATYGPALATDDNPDSRWSAASAATTAWLQLDFGAPTTFSRVVANEYLTRIQSYNLQSWDGSAWQIITSGTTLGESARIDFPAVTTTKLRLNILAASDAPSLWMFKVQAGGIAPPPPDHDSTWIAPTGGVWQVAGLWENAGVASGIDRNARFDTLDLTSDATVTLQSPLAIGFLRFGDTTSSHDWTLEAIDNHPLTLATSSGSPAINVANRSTTISAILAGTNGLTKTGDGTLVLAATNTYSGATYLTSGALLVDGSTAAASPVIAASGTTLGGTGSIRGPIILASGSTLAPGHNGPGVLTVETALTLAAGTTTAMELQKSGSTLTSDRVVGPGGITYGGALTVIASGDALAGGDSFTLFSFPGGSDAGTFTTLELPALGVGLRWNTSGLATTGTIQVSDIGAAKPVFSIPSGCYFGAQSITLACTTPGALIHFTTDGSIPGAASPVYSTPIAVAAGGTLAINALAMAPGLENSPVVSATYSTGSSALTIQAWYHLGEASSLGTNNRPQDASGNARHFVNNQNFPTSSTDDASGPLGRSGFTSTAALVCGSGQINGFWNNNYALPADNSGMEIWVKGSSRYTNGWIIATGVAAGNLVLAVNGSSYRASVTGGSTWFDDNTAAVSSNAWTHLALVRAGGTTTFYVNGAAHGTSSASVTVGGVAHLGVTSGGNSGFKGLLDEARMFTFGVGAFQVRDLLFRANHTPAFDPNPRVLGATQGSFFTISAAATDVDPAETLIHSKLGGPAWLTVAADGTLTGTPALADVGTHFFSIRATDSLGAAATLMLTMTVAPLNPDANGNGMLDSWENVMFGNADAGANLAIADADGDGLSNFLEYALNTDPRQANANPVACQLVPVSGQTYVCLTFPKNPLATNLTCVVEMSEDLDPGSWAAAPTVVENESATGLTLRVTQPVSAATRNFFRLRFVATP